MILLKTGSLYRINLNKAKASKLSIDKKNKQISIDKNTIKYNVKYNFNNDKTEFNTTLAFDSSMDESKCRNEYNKMFDLGFLYATVANIGKADIKKSVSYFDKLLSENSSPYHFFKSPVDYAKEVFKTHLNIQDNQFTLTTKTTQSTDDKYVVDVTLSVNNSALVNTSGSDANSNSNSSSSKTSNSSKNVLNITSKLPQTGHFINIKYLLIITISLSFIAIICLKTKENKNK